MINEITWEKVTAESGSPEPLMELTSVTRRPRRIASFDPEVVVQAIRANRPTCIALNHLDYIDFRCRTDRQMTSRAAGFLEATEKQIDHFIELVGYGPALMNWRDTHGRSARDSQFTIRV
jgi:adenylosuccinate synthase